MLALAFALAAMLAIAGTASASSSTAGPSYGHFTDLCAKSASPAAQSVVNSSGSASATVTSTLTKKADYVEEWKWVVWPFWGYWDNVKTWGCVTGGSAPAAGNVAAAGVTVNWSVVSGPNSGRSGSGTTNSSGVSSFNYTGTTNGTDTVRITATRRWCTLANTALASC